MLSLRVHLILSLIDVNHLSMLQEL